MRQIRESLDEPIEGCAACQRETVPGLVAGGPETTKPLVTERCDPGWIRGNRGR